MNRGNPTIFNAGLLLQRLWDVEPLAGFDPADIPLLIECHGARLRVDLLPCRLPSMLMACAEDVDVIVVDGRCALAAQQFYALSELCALLDGVLIQTDAHRLAAAICLLPEYGLGALRRALEDDDPSFAHGRLPELLRWAGPTIRLAARNQVGSYCLARAQEARARGCDVEAIAWFRRTERAQVATAEVRARASLGHGNVLLALGRIGEAEAVLRRGLSRMRSGELAAMHAHDLMVICVTMKRWAEAEQWANRAALLYGRGHPRLPRLAGDTAEMWARQGFHLRALPVFEAAAAQTEDSELAAAWWANAAACALAVGAKERASARVDNALARIDWSRRGRIVQETLATVMNVASSTDKWLAREVRGQGAGPDASRGDLEEVAPTVRSHADELAARLVRYMRAA